MTRGNCESPCPGYVKSHALGNRGASSLSVSRIHPKLAGKIRIACTLFDHVASNGRQDLVFALPISFCTSVIGQGNLWSQEVGMTIAVAIAFAAVMLCGLTLIFITLREELKRDLPRQEL